MAFLRDSALYCISNFTYSTSEKHTIGGICMATSIIGFLGAALQIKSLWQYRDRQRRRPSPNPKIIFYLALSDVIACIGVFALAICFIALKPPIAEFYKSYTKYIPADKSLYESVVTILEVMTLFSYLASYVWTFSYALDMYFQIIQIDCPMIVYHIVAWLFPLDLVAIVEGINFGVYGTGQCQYKSGQMSRLISSYFLIVVVIIGNSLLLWLTYKKIKKVSRSTAMHINADRIALYKFKRKFLFMVFAFTICWLPNIVSVCHDIYNISRLKDKEKYPKNRDSIWKPCVYIEAIFNPLQGMLNYLIYRNAFKVTTTNTRLPRDSLPSTVSDDDQNRGATNQTVQTIANSSQSYEEKTPIFRSFCSSNNPYVSKLLGE